MNCGVEEEIARALGGRFTFESVSPPPCLRRLKSGALPLLFWLWVALLVVLSDICSKLEHLIVCAAVCKGFTGGGVLLDSSVWAYLMGTTD